MAALLSLALSWLRSYWPYAAIGTLALLCWHFDSRAVANADAVRIQAAQFKDAQAAATAIAQQALQHQEATYQAKATEADNAHQIALAAAQTAADQYIAAHRVQPAPAARDAGAAAAAGQNPGAAIPANVPADAVMVSADDVHACTGAVAYALKARDYVLNLSAASQSNGGEPNASP